MLKRSIVLAALTALTALTVCAVSLPARAETIGFEDVDTSSDPDFPYGFLADVYRGLVWDGDLGAESWIVTGNTELWLGVPAHAGNNAAWANGSNAANLSISAGFNADPTFNFNGFWARNSYAPGHATLTGYREGAVLYTRELDFTDAYAFYQLAFSNVDRVTFTNMDVTPVFDDISIGAVPEPQHAWMLLVGLGATALLTRRARLSR